MALEMRRVEQFELRITKEIRNYCKYSDGHVEECVMAMMKVIASLAAEDTSVAKLLKHMTKAIAEQGPQRVN